MQFCGQILEPQRNKLPPPTGLKCVGSGGGSVIQPNYEEGDHVTQGEGVKKQ
jgi:hypothetical protein